MVEGHEGPRLTQLPHGFALVPWRLDPLAARASAGGGAVTSVGIDYAVSVVRSCRARPEAMASLRQALRDVGSGFDLGRRSDQDVVEQVARLVERRLVCVVRAPALAIRMPLSGEDVEEEVSPSMMPQDDFGFVADIDVHPPPLIEHEFVAEAPLRLEPSIVFEPPPREIEEAPPPASESRAAAPADEEAPRAEAVEPAPATTFIEVAMIGMDGKPVSGLRYRLELTDGTTSEGVLDGSGLVRIDGIDAGSCTLTFPDLDQDAWEAE